VWGVGCGVYRKNEAGKINASSHEMTCLDDEKALYTSS
jgi:hypothetical protein